MRAFQGESGAFTYAVSEFLRISQAVPPKSIFYCHIPELRNGSLTPTGLPVQVQLLGGNAGRMAESAGVAVEAGAKAIDINFGCPARTVNRHDGGATLLQYPRRIREIVGAVRAAVPRDVPVSAKLRLGWDSIDAIDENAEMAAEGGASWLTIHGRTRFAGYAPPIHWEPIGRVRERLQIPVVANGDIWNIEGFRRCREETGCRHFMLGRGSRLANPKRLTPSGCRRIGNHSAEGNRRRGSAARLAPAVETIRSMDARNIAAYAPGAMVRRLKQWLKMATTFGNFAGFDSIKRAANPEELIAILKSRSCESTN